jgi:hypothetical protein
MYEHGMRLGREVPSRLGLQKQVQCYLAAMNALRLVDPVYAWIVKPTACSESQVMSFLSSESFNRKDSGSLN